MPRDAKRDKFGFHEAHRVLFPYLTLPVPVIAKILNYNPKHLSIRLSDACCIADVSDGRNTAALVVFLIRNRLVTAKELYENHQKYGDLITEYERNLYELRSAARTRVRRLREKRINGYAKNRILESPSKAVENASSM